MYDKKNKTTLVTTISLTPATMNMLDDLIARSGLKRSAMITLLIHTAHHDKFSRFTAPDTRVITAS